MSNNKNLISDTFINMWNERLQQIIVNNNHFFLCL